MKALSDLVAADPAVLAQPAAQAAVERMLSDEAVSVRAEAVALLGRHMAADPSLALPLFDAVCRATGDPGPSVRRAALKTLRDCCAAPRGFARAADAARALLAHAADPEESVRALAAGALGALWFSPALAGVERSPTERAAALAAAAAALHAAAVAAAGAAGALLLPYEDSHALVAALRAALAAAPAADRAAAGRALADALLEAVLDAGGTGACGFGSQGEEDADSAAGDNAFPALLALHALAAAEPALAAPPDDPGRFVRSLAPYAKQAPPSPAGNGPAAAAAARARADRAAEALQCVLAVLAAVASGGGSGAAAAARLDGGAGAGLSRDLQALASTHLHVPVISGAVKALGALARAGAPAAGARLAETGRIYSRWLQPIGEPRMLGRALFTLGELCRWAAPALEAQRLSVDALAAAALARWRDGGGAEAAGIPGLPATVRLHALEALGKMAVGAPPGAAAARAAAEAALGEALAEGAPPACRAAALTALQALLQAEADALAARQATAAAAEAAAAGGKKGAGKKGGKPGAGGDAALPAVATANGEGELSRASGVLQRHWPAVLAAAAGASAAAGPEGGAPVRRRALALLDVVLRDGLVGPWTAVPALAALALDEDAAARPAALRVLLREADVHARYVDAAKLWEGVGAAAGRRPAPGAPPRPLGAPPGARAGAAALYAELVWPRRALRVAFLKAALRRFRPAVALARAGGAAGGAAARVDVRALAFTAAVLGSLPLRRGDEVCLLAAEASDLVSRHADEALHQLRTGAEAEVAVDAPDVRALKRAAGAAAALALLLLLKRHLLALYSVAPERVAAFSASADKRRQEERAGLARAPGAPPELGLAAVEAMFAAPTAAGILAGLKRLLAEDAAAAPRRGGGGADGEESDDAAGGGAAPPARKPAAKKRGRPPGPAAALAARKRRAAAGGAGGSGDSSDDSADADYRP
jgi:hypothetical protein